MSKSVLIDVYQTLAVSGADDFTLGSFIVDLMTSYNPRFPAGYMAMGVLSMSLNANV